MDILVNIFESFLGDYRKHNEDTGQVSFDCPACSMESGQYNGDGKGNLEINYQKGVYRCWVCSEYNQMSGYIPKLIKKYGSAKNLRDYNLIKPETNWKRRHVDIEVKLPKEYIRLWDAKVKNYPYKLAMQYLYDRGITDEIIKYYQLGYCPSGHYFSRIIFPSFDANNNINFFVGRWISEKPNKNKYLNPDVDKEELIFNEYLINWDADIYLVEGATDHVVIPNSIPILGKYLTEKLFEEIYAKANAKVIIVLDGEDLAYLDAIEIYKKLNVGDLRDRIRIVRPPDDEDPSSIYKAEGYKGVIRLLKTAKKLKESKIY